MTEVFITDIGDLVAAKSTLQSLRNSFPGLKINFDAGDSATSYPCGHSILRVEGTAVDSEGIMSMLSRSGIMCDVLEDKICR